MRAITSETKATTTPDVKDHILATGPRVGRDPVKLVEMLLDERSITPGPSNWHTPTEADGPVRDCPECGCRVPFGAILTHTAWHVSLVKPALTEADRDG